MKRLARLMLAVGLVLAPAAFAQEPSTAPVGDAAAKEAREQKEAFEKKEAQEKALAPWKWVNFLILAGGLGYLIGKNAPGFFAERGAGIRRGLDEAEAARLKAEARTAEVERRLATLETEIAVIREESQRQGEAAAARLAQDASAQIARIQATSEQEIASAGKSARTELRRYSAELSIGLAEQRLRERMTPQAQDSLVDGFEKSLAAAKARTL